MLLGNGDGTFQSHMDYWTGTAPTSVAVDDFNGDGKLDLAVVNDGSNTVSILRQVTPPVTLCPITVNFGHHMVGTASGSEAVTLTNAGNRSAHH